MRAGQHLVRGNEPVELTRKTRIPGELLWSYVEGRLERRTSEAIDRYLADNPEVLQDVRVMEHQQELLEMVEASVLEEPVPERLTRVIERARRQRRDGKEGDGGGEEG